MVMSMRLWRLLAASMAVTLLWPTWSIGQESGGQHALARRDRRGLIA
jgi:hypothetical protein